MRLYDHKVTPMRHTNFDNEIDFYTRIYHPKEERLLALLALLAITITGAILLLERMGAVDAFIQSWN